jgi:hypothetical protein
MAFRSIPHALQDEEHTFSVPEQLRGFAMFVTIL